jgi:hypothetical protein
MSTAWPTSSAGPRPFGDMPWKNWSQSIGSSPSRIWMGLSGS